MIQSPVLGEISYKDLAETFELVCNPEDRKAPIQAVVLESEVDMAIEAVLFFTGAIVDTKQYEGDEVILIESEGYRKSSYNP